MSTSEGQHRWESLERKLERQDWDGMDIYGGKMMGILGEGCWGWSCQERGNGEGRKSGLWMWWKRTWLRLKWRRKIQLIETTGEGKSAVATPDGKSRKKKKIAVCRWVWMTGAWNHGSIWFFESVHCLDVHCILTHLVPSIHYSMCEEIFPDIINYEWYNVFSPSLVSNSSYNSSYALLRHLFLRPPPLVASPYTLVYSLHPSVHPTSSSPISSSECFLARPHPTTKYPCLLSSVSMTLLVPFLLCLSLCLP